MVLTGLHRVEKSSASTNQAVRKATDALSLQWLKALGEEFRKSLIQLVAYNRRSFSAILSLQTSVGALLAQLVLVGQSCVLEDALGRRTPFELQFINSWEAFQAILEVRFRNARGHSRVRCQQYVLQDAKTRSDIDFFRPWDTALVPGQTYNMHIMFYSLSPRHAVVTECPRCEAEMKCCSQGKTW